jgi:hypothetical protein
MEASMDYFKQVKDYLQELSYEITSEDPTDEILIISNENKGIKNLIIDCESPILIIEQFITDLKNGSADTYRSLLQMNRTLVHGAFVLDESGEKLIFRDTLQIANLDLNELEGSINALELCMAEYASTLISFATKEH